MRMGQKTEAWKSTYENKQGSNPYKDSGGSSLFPESLVLRIGVFALCFVSISLLTLCPIVLDTRTWNRAPSELKFTARILSLLVYLFLDTD